MENAAVMALPAREVDPREWGKVILEEILFRAGRDASLKASDDAGIAVSLEFDVRTDESARTIEICLSGAVESVIKLRLPLDLI